MVEDNAYAPPCQFRPGIACSPHGQRIGEAELRAPIRLDVMVPHATFDRTIKGKHIPGW